MTGKSFCAGMAVLLTIAGVTTACVYSANYIDSFHAKPPAIVQPEEPSVKEDFKINYYYSNGVTKYRSATCQEGENLVAPEMPSYNGLFFYRWETEIDGQKVLIKNSELNTIKPTADMSFTAKFGSPLNYSVGEVEYNGETLNAVTGFAEGYTASSIKIPSSYAYAETGELITGNDYKVEAIAAHAFENNTKVNGVTMPLHMKYFGEACFKGCNFILDISFSSLSYVEYIGRDAFNLTGMYKGSTILEFERMPKLKFVGHHAFNLESFGEDKPSYSKTFHISVPEGCVIENGAFFGMNDVSLFPSYAVDIGLAFEDCNFKDINLGSSYLGHSEFVLLEENNNSFIVIFVLPDCLEDFKSDIFWTQYADKIEGNSLVGGVH